LPSPVGEDAALRVTTLRVLGRLGDPRALPALARALDNGSSAVRRAGAEALGLLGARAGALLGQLESAARCDPRLDVRGACLLALDLIHRALRDAPAELEASGAPAGRGTELVAS